MIFIMITYSEVCLYFKEFKCELITQESEYKNLSSRVDWKCKCGNISNSIFRVYKTSKTHLCKKCSYEIRKINNLEKYGVENVGELKKYKYTDVYDYFISQKCKLITKEYNSAHDKLEYICVCGNINITRYCDFKNKDTRCSYCGNQKRIITNFKLYNVEYVSQSESFKTKMKANNLIKYGVENVSQNKDIRHKIKQSSFSYKDYKFPSGKIVKIQGNENNAIDILLKKYCEDDILVDSENIPIIDYYDDKDRKYYPDIYIEKDNLIIEVKSTWTFEIKYDKNMIKYNATKALGYNYEIWIFNNKNELIKQLT